MRLAVWLLWAAWSSGCSDRSADFARYVPESSQARASLEAALADWQNGNPPGAVEDTTPAVQVVDTHRRAGQRLERFEILGEVGGDAGRCFSVRLKLADPDEEQKVRFIVIGINPVWVFREDDFTMLTHWDHPMPDDSARETKEPAAKEKP